MSDLRAPLSPQHSLTRRDFLAAGIGFAAWSRLPRSAYAAPRDPRLVVVILRGALDGLGVVPPIGDPDYERVRGELAIGVGGTAKVLPLDGFFGMNVSMPALHAQYRAGDALVVHAVATPYRDRSHFDGQDVLESGMPWPRDTASGWLNRAVMTLPTEDAVRPIGLAVNPTVPLIFRGSAPTLTWTPPNFHPASFDTVERLIQLYRETDGDLLNTLMRGRRLDKMSSSQNESDLRGSSETAVFREAAEGAARLLTAEDGPRVAALSFDGWDTHANEGAEDGRLATRLRALDDALDGLANGLKSIWRDTVVVVVTEFGRTAYINGSEGTDHGTATTAFVLGGAVNGGASARRLAGPW